MLTSGSPTSASINPLNQPNPSYMYPAFNHLPTKPFQSPNSTLLTASCPLPTKPSLNTKLYPDPCPSLPNFFGAQTLPYFLPPPNQTFLEPNPLSFTVLPDPPNQTLSKRKPYPTDYHLPTKILPHPNPTQLFSLPPPYQILILLSTLTPRNSCPQPYFLSIPSFSQTLKLISMVTVRL